MSKAGFVYLVACPNRMYAKVGRWRNSLRSLRARYATYYGAPSLKAVWVQDAVELERQLKRRVADERLQLFQGRRLELVRCTRRVFRIFDEMTERQV